MLHYFCYTPAHLSILPYTSTLFIYMLILCFPVFAGHETEWAFYRSMLKSGRNNLALLSVMGLLAIPTIAAGVAMIQRYSVLLLTANTLSATAAALRDSACGTVLAGRCLHDSACRTVLAGQCLQDNACRTVLVGQCLQDSACKRVQA